MSAHRLLSRERFLAPRRFVLRRARPLVAARFRFHVEGGCMESALAVRRTVALPSGGFRPEAD